MQDAQEPTAVAKEGADELRLSDLEAAEEHRAESRRLDRRFEMFEAVLLSIAALLVAWTGFQSAKWSGVQANSYSQAGASRVESTRSSTLAGQQTTVDVITFTQWLQAAGQEGLLTEPPDPDTGYVPDPTLLSGFLYERFRPEFRVAVDAWVATSPRINADVRRQPRSPCPSTSWRPPRTPTGSRSERRSRLPTCAPRTNGPTTTCS